MEMIDLLKQKLTDKPTFVADSDYREGEVQIVAQVPFPTRFGEFSLIGIYDGIHAKEHTAVIKGDVHGATACPVRVHSECHTGDIWSSLRCDCRDQLEAALEYIGNRERGVVLYLRQEGRGIGLLNKIKAYHLQDLGLDTVEANQYLGFPSDARDYGIAARIIELLEIGSIALMSNNPDKLQKLRDAGIDIVERIPLLTNHTQYNRQYLQTKKQRMGHIL